ncbi:MAG: glycoside hydrolase family 25 protein [Oscillospiraceae bacterium]|jgi:GH25 family lysozyme M1 (1,4-beta-N-acetylmuramidase)
MIMAYKGIDVSKYQGEIDWEKVKADGVEFAIIRAGYGRELSQKDLYFESNYEGAKAAGLQVGTYWYSYAESAEDAKQEASAFLTSVSGKAFDLPVYYDVEENTQAQKGRGFVTSCILAFTNEVKKAGYAAGVYANTNWLKNYIDLDKLGGMSIWKADWSQEPDEAIACDIHQYTSNGSVNGISGRCDMNTGYADFCKIPNEPAFSYDVFYRVRTKAHGWLSQVKNLDDYAGWKDSPITDIAVKASAGSVKYRVHVKGGDWLPYVTGYDVNEGKNGYAGNGKPIDAVEIYYYTPEGVKPAKKAKYRVAPVGKDYYSWQVDNEKTNGQDGYAGVFGREIAKLQIIVE